MCGYKKAAARTHLLFGSIVRWETWSPNSTNLWFSGGCPRLDRTSLPYAFPRIRRRMLLLLFVATPISIPMTRKQRLTIGIDSRHQAPLSSIDPLLTLLENSEVVAHGKASDYQTIGRLHSRDALRFGISHSTDRSNTE